MNEKWNINYTDEFGNWWQEQSVPVQERLAERIYQEYLVELEVDNHDSSL